MTQERKSGTPNVSSKEAERGRLKIIEFLMQLGDAAKQPAVQEVFVDAAVSVAAKATERKNKKNNPS